MSQPSNTRFEFGPFSVDPVERLLSRDGVPVTLPAKAFDLLLVFLQNPGRALGKAELMQELWPGIVVEENNLTVHMSVLRKALGEDAAERRYIETLPRRGYRFIAPVNYGSVPTARHESSRTPPATPAASSAPLPPAASRPRPSRHNLPAEATAFIGRSEELARLGRWIDDPERRLITIVAPGGMGKSRLALEAARQLLERSDRFASGVFLVELAPLASAELIVAAIADAIALEFDPGRDAKAQLFERLREQDILLVLDNLEHVAEAALLVSDLLRGAPRLEILATSREALGLRAETRFALSGLVYPESDVLPDAASCGSVRLFMEEARRFGAELEPAPRELEQVVRIARLVQGSPLALVLAASWATLLTLAEIATEIGRNVDFLRANFADMPERQRSIRAVFDQSWKLLGDEERAIFAQLSVFNGGFTRAAAEAVAHAPLGALSTLSNKSLLRRDPDTGRYRVHELSRQYAEAKLRETPAACEAAFDRHARYYAEFLAEREAALQGPDPRRSLSEIDGEIDNVRLAWRRMLERKQIDTIGVALEALNAFYEHRASFRGEQAALGQAVLGLDSESLTYELAKIMRVVMRSTRRRAQGEQERDRGAMAARALDLVDEHVLPRERAAALETAALALEAATGLKDGSSFGERALVPQRADAGQPGLAQALERLASVCVRAGYYGRAEAYYREVLALEQGAASGTPRSGSSASGLGWALALTGSYAEARPLLDGALQRARARGDASDECACLLRLAELERRLGAYPEALGYAGDALGLSRRLGDEAAEIWSARVLGDAHAERLELAAARAHYQSSHALAQRAGDVAALGWAELALGDLALEERDPAAAAQHLAASQRAFQRCAIVSGEARVSNSLGFLCCARAEFAGAREHFLRAFNAGRAARALPLQLYAVCGVALGKARLGQSLKAVELLALVERHPAAEHRLRNVQAPALLAELAGPLDPDELAAARARAESLELDAEALAL